MKTLISPISAHFYMKQNFKSSFFQFLHLICRQKYVLKNIHTVVFKLLSIYTTTTKKNQFDCLECEKKVQRKSITFVLQFCSKTQQEAIVRLISLNFFLRTETKMISTFSHHHFPLLYISRELKKPQKVFFPLLQ